MPEFRARPTHKVPIGQEWVDHGYQTKPSTKSPEPCPLCGLINCGVDTHVEESAAAYAARQEEFQRIDAERAAAEQRGRDEFAPIRGW